MLLLLAMPFQDNCHLLSIKFRVMSFPRLQVLPDSILAAIVTSQVTIIIINPMLQSSHGSSQSPELIPGLIGNKRSLDPEEGQESG